MHYKKITIVSLLLFQAIICMELNTKTNKTTCILENKSCKKNIMAQQIRKKTPSHSDPITNEIIQILQLNLLVEVKAIVAHERNDQNNVTFLEEMAAQRKSIKQEKIKNFQEEQKKILAKERQDYFRQQQNLQQKLVQQINIKIFQKIVAQKKYIKEQALIRLQEEQKKELQQKQITKSPQNKPTKTKKRKKKKTQYIIPDLPTPSAKPTTNIRPIKNELQQTIMIKRILIKDNNASNEADLKKMLTDFCHDNRTPCVFRVFNDTAGWHYDRKTNDLSIIFNDAPTPCGYDHASSDSSSD